MKPIAFMDVDGVLNRIVSNKEAKRRKLARKHGWSAGLRWPLWLDYADKERVARLSEHFDMGWGTTWETDAYSQIAEPLGIPRFDIVAITGLSEGSKAPGVARAAEGRPFVWFDDDLDYEDISEFVEQPHKVIMVDSATGLTDEHVEEAIAWLGQM